MTKNTDSFTPPNLSINPLREYEKSVFARNVAWKKASKQRKRIWLAKDVLAQLNAKYFHVRSGVYLRDAESAAECEGCALGGLTIACALRDNIPDPKHNEKLGSGLRDGDRDKMVEKLGQFFPQDQLDLIETAFEMGIGIHNTERRVIAELGRDSGYKIKNWCDYFYNYNQPYTQAEARLRLIMARIINNNGVFNPLDGPPTPKDYKVAGVHQNG